jgi:hypothetical protein
MVLLYFSFQDFSTPQRRDPRDVSKSNDECRMMNDEKEK